MLAVFAQFETDVRRDRQAEGIAKAKKLGVYTGGKPRISRAEVAALIKGGNGPAAIARTLGVSRMSVYRIKRLKKFRQNWRRSARQRSSGTSSLKNWVARMSKRPVHKLLVKHPT